MIKKLIASFVVIMASVVVLAGENEPAGIFGGQMRLIPYDSAAGTRTTITPLGVSATNSTGRYIGTVVDFVRLSIRSKLSDMVSVQVEPSFKAAVNGMPAFGQNVGGQVNNSAALFDVQAFDMAKVIIDIPGGSRISSGIMRAKLTWDFGNYMAEKTAIMDTKFSSDNAGVIYDSGIEFNTNLMIDGAKVPLTFQLLNGGSPAVDFNQSVAWLARVEPTIMGIKLHGSYFSSMTPAVNPDNRFALGAEYDYGRLYLRTEYVYGGQTNARTQKNGTSNATLWTSDSKTSNGYYVIARYSFPPKIKVSAQYAVLEMNHFDGIAYGNAKELDRDLALSCEYAFTPDFSMTATYWLSNYSRKDSAAYTGFTSEILDFNRFIVGSRIAF